MAMTAERAVLDEYWQWWRLSKSEQFQEGQKTSGKQKIICWSTQLKNLVRSVQAKKWNLLLRIRGYFLVDNQSTEDDIKM